LSPDFDRKTRNTGISLTISEIAWLVLKLSGRKDTIITVSKRVNVLSGDTKYIIYM